MYQSSWSQMNKKELTEDLNLTLCVHLSRLRLSPAFTNISGNKRKRKEDYIFADRRYFQFFSVVNIYIYIYIQLIKYQTPLHALVYIYIYEDH